MRLEVSDRRLGEVPVGALLMIPLFFLPAGAYAVEHGLFDLGRCGMKAAFGIPCLSCGSTRATIALFHGHFVEAVLLQPMMMFIYAMLLTWGSISLWGFIRKKSVWLRLTDREDLLVKLLIIFIPVTNWAYLIWAGV